MQLLIHFKEWLIKKMCTMYIRTIDSIWTNNAQFPTTAHKHIITRMRQHNEYAIYKQYISTQNDNTAKAEK